MSADFDEDAWPCAAAHRESYRQACSRGRERMARAQVAICGLARDVADVLPSTMARIRHIGSLFADYRVVIYENDSRDDSLGELQAWERTDPRVTILSEVLGHPR